MNGNVPPHAGPAPARSDSNAEPPADARPGEAPAAAGRVLEVEPGAAAEPLKRASFDLLDEYWSTKATGYDPYNTTSTQWAAEIWRRKPKRD